MSRSMLSAAAATIAAALLMPQAPALGQEPGIVVTAPRAPVPNKFSVQRPVQLNAHVWVPAADLDLRTAYGRYVLNRRMQFAADDACGQLRAIAFGGVGSFLNPDPQNCRQTAYHNARRAASYLIWAAG